MPSPLDYFGITPPGNPLSQFFPQQGGDDAFRAQLEERPRNPAPQQSGVFGPQDYQLAGMTGDPQGTLAMAQKIREDMQSQKIIRGLSSLDFGSKDFSPSVAKLLSQNPLGAQHSAVQNILKLKEFSGQQARDKNLNTKAAEAMKSFYGLDPSDPDYAEKHQKFVEGLDPEVLADTRVDRLIQTGYNNANTQRAKRSAQEQERMAVEKEARRLGIKPSKYDNLDDLNDSIADRMAQQGQRKELSEFFKTQPELRKEYAGAMSRLRAPTSGQEWDQEKADALGKTIKDMTPEDWHNAHGAALQKRLNSVRALNNEIALSTGINPMMGAKAEEEAVAPAQAVPVAAPTPTQLPPELLPEGAAGTALPAESPESFQPVGTLPVTAPVAPKAPQPGFAGLQQKISTQDAAEVAKTAAETAKQREVEQANIPIWESAKQELLKNFQPDYANWGMGDLNNLTAALGKKTTDTAFKDATGRNVTWGEVTQQLMNDPRMEQIRSGKTIAQAAPIASIPGSGRKFTVGAPIQVK